MCTREFCFSERNTSPLSSRPTPSSSLRGQSPGSGSRSALSVRHRTGPVQSCPYRGPISKCWGRRACAMPLRWLYSTLTTWPKDWRVTTRSSSLITMVREHSNEYNVDKKEQWDSGKPHLPKLPDIVLVLHVYDFLLILPVTCSPTELFYET